jgi:hypothetical protein
VSNDLTPAQEAAVLALGADYTNDEEQIARAKYAADRVEAAVREQVAREMLELREPLTQWLEAWSTGDASVWAEGSMEGAADLTERLARIARGEQP